MGLLQYSHSLFDEGPDPDDPESTFRFEAACAAQDPYIASSAWLPGADRARPQMPPQRNLDLASVEAQDDADIFSDALSDK